MIKISKLVKKNHCDFAYPTQSIVVKKEEDELGKIEEIKLYSSIFLLINQQLFGFSFYLKILSLEL